MSMHIRQRHAYDFLALNSVKQHWIPTIAAKEMMGFGQLWGCGGAGAFHSARIVSTIRAGHRSTRGAGARYGITRAAHQY